jgi:hypothetical protein
MKLKFLDNEKIAEDILQLARDKGVEVLLAYGGMEVVL